MIILIAHFNFFMKVVLRNNKSALSLKPWQVIDVLFKNQNFIELLLISFYVLFKFSSSDDSSSSAVAIKSISKHFVCLKIQFLFCLIALLHLFGYEVILFVMFYCLIATHQWLAFQVMQQTCIVSLRAWVSSWQVNSICKFEIHNWS